MTNNIYSSIIIITKEKEVIKMEEENDFILSLLEKVKDIEKIEIDKEKQTIKIFKKVIDK